MECNGMAWKGMTSHGKEMNYMAWHGMAWKGKARHGMESKGKERHGMAWKGMQTFSATHKMS
jgi:hypothetical protein